MGTGWGDRPMQLLGGGKPRGSSEQDVATHLGPRYSTWWAVCLDVGAPCVPMDMPRGAGSLLAVHVPHPYCPSPAQVSIFSAQAPDWSI